MWKLLSLTFALALMAVPAAADSHMEGEGQSSGEEYETMEDVLQSPADETLNAPADEVLDAPLDSESPQEAQPEQEPMSDDPAQETIVPEGEDSQDSATQETILPLDEEQSQDSGVSEEGSDEGLF